MSDDLVRRGPLTDQERALIDATTNQLWTRQLSVMLRQAVEARGISTSTAQNPGDLADLLERFADE